MNKIDLTEYVDFLLNAAIYKCGNIVDAEDLVQDTLLAALVILERKSIDNPAMITTGGLMSTINII